MPVSAGDCFILPDSGGEHLCIVLTDYKGDPPSIILVNITSWKRHKDQTVIIETGEHAFVIKKSVVAYDMAVVLEEWRIERLLRLAKMQPRASADLLKKIRDGLLTSPRVPGKVVDFLKS